MLDRNLPMQGIRWRMFDTLQFVVNVHKRQRARQQIRSRLS